MKRHLPIVATILFVLSLLYNMVVWGAVPRVPDVGDAIAASARREALLASTYIALGGPLDAGVPALQAYGEQRVVAAFADGFDRIRADGTVAMDLIFNSRWNAQHAWLKTVYWWPPILLVLSLLAWWRRPRQVRSLGGGSRR